MYRTRFFFQLKNEDIPYLINKLGVMIILLNQIANLVHYHFRPIPNQVL